MFSTLFSLNRMSVNIGGRRHDVILKKILPGQLDSTVELFTTVSRLIGAIAFCKSTYQPQTDTFLKP